MRATASKGFKILRERGFTSFLDACITLLRRSAYTWKGDRFGIPEALCFPDGFMVDLYTRYSPVLEELRRLRKPGMRILEIGASTTGLGMFLPLTREIDPRCRVVLLDIDERALQDLGSGLRVVAEADRLPFRDAHFDLVLAIDVVEHLPPPVRATCYREMRRVAAGTVLLHAPARGGGGRFRGDEADRRFRSAFRERNPGQPEPDWVREHLDAGHPAVEELLDAFPGAEIRGSQNVEAWLRYMSFGPAQSRRVGRLFTGLLYLFRLRDRDRNPPFRSCFVNFDPKRAEAPRD